jgi:hypothetical protein
MEAHHEGHGRGARRRGSVALVPNDPRPRDHTDVQYQNRYYAASRIANVHLSK